MRNVSGIPQGSLNWVRTPIGGTGWVEGGIAFDSAGNMIAGGDENGCWIGKPDSNGRMIFNDLMKTTILPGGSYGPGVTNNTPNSGNFYGCAANAIYWANGNIAYFVFNCYIYKVTNALSATPTATQLTGGPFTPWEANISPRPRFMRQAVIDPQNSNYALFGNYGTSVIYTTDGATTTVLTVPANATSGGNPTPHLVAVDPSSTVSGGQKQVWYYTVYGGVNGGVYRSTTGIAGPYSLVSGSPNKPCSLKVDSSGNVWCLNDAETQTGDTTGSFSGTTFNMTALASGAAPQIGDKLWNGSTTQSGNWCTVTAIVAAWNGTSGSYTVSPTQGTISSQETWVTPGNIYKASAGGSFSKVAFPSPYTFGDIAINPQNLNEIVIIDSNFVLGHSLDGGVTWTPNSRILSGQIKKHSNSIGWMQGRNSTGTSYQGLGGLFSGGQIEFHPTNNYLHVGGGVGVLKILPPSTGNATWYFQEDTLGIEQYVATSIMVPPNGNPIYFGGDVNMMEVFDNNYAHTKSSIPQPAGGAGDNTGWAGSWVPGQGANFLVCASGYWSNNHSYRDRRSNASADWTVFPGTFPVTGVTYGGGPLLAPTVSDFYMFPISNLRPVSVHSLSGNWAYEDVNIPGMMTKAFGYIGAGASQIRFASVADYNANGSTQLYNITINAASGAGSVSVVGTTVTITPPAGTTTANALITYLNGVGAFTAVLTCVATGAGTGAMPTGTVSGPGGSPATTLGFESGWGWFPIFYITTVFNACIDGTNGDIYAINYGDSTLGINAPWSGIYKRSQAGGTWSRVASCPFSSSAPRMVHVYGQAGHVLISGAGGLWRTTNGFTSNSQVGDGVHNFTNTGAIFTGAAAPGESYPAVYVYGALNAVYDLWVCEDGTFTNWRNLGQYPGNYVYSVGQGDADKITYGKVEIGFSGGGVRGAYTCNFTGS